jgi:hypothetical protein
MKTLSRQWGINGERASARTIQKRASAANSPGSIAEARIRR